MFTQIIKKFKKYLWLGPMVAGFMVRIYQLTTASIWHDEGYTMWLLRYNIPEIIARTARDVHPPGYYLIAKPWVELFGTSVFSIRFLSLIFSMGIIYFAFKTIKEAFNERAGYWTGMFIALSPFMVRFAQEARMYGVVAFFTTLATYFLVKYIKEKDHKYLLFYIPAMIIAVYTQYYAFFVVFSHWIILSLFTDGFWKLKLKDSIKAKVGILDWRWWLSNLAIVIAYIPWFTVAYKQVTRVSGSYWIKPEWITIKTIPNNIYQFLIYAHPDVVYDWSLAGKVMFWVIIAVLLSSGYLLWKNKTKFPRLMSLYVFGLLPMLLVYILSKLRTPVYQDRYFPFSAVGLFALWGTAVSFINRKNLRLLVAGIFMVTFIVSNFFMHFEPHSMLGLKKVVSSNQREGDVVLSGELYTYLDGAYYFGYDNIKLLSAEVDGYGETSLFYDQQSKYLYNPADISELPERVWVIGKTGEKEYFSDKLWSGYFPIIYYEETQKINGLKAVLYTKD